MEDLLKITGLDKLDEANKNMRSKSMRQVMLSTIPNALKEDALVRSAAYQKVQEKNKKDSLQDKEN